MPRNVSLIQASRNRLNSGGSLSEPITKDELFGRTNTASSNPKTNAMPKRSNVMNAIDQLTAQHYAKLAEIEAEKAMGN